MNDDADLADPGHETKHSKRAMFKDALARTKNKFRKDDKNQDFSLSQDVNDFLAAGKASTHPDDELQPRPSLNSSSNDLLPPHQSPRGASVPRLDVSQSTRFPNARPVGLQGGADGNSHDLLRPDGQPKGRSQSFTSPRRKKLRPKNLSVSFDSRPPVIIGIGGDEAQQPPCEISKLRQKALALVPEPQQRPRSNHSHTSQGSVSLIHCKPIPRGGSVSPADDFAPPRLLQRVQTGVGNLKSPAEREYELSLQTPQSANTPVPDGRFKTAIISPQPIHLPTAPPRVQSPPVALESRFASEQAMQQVPLIHPIKQGAMRVMVTDEDLMNRQPRLPSVMPPSLPSSQQVRVNPGVPLMMPHQQFVHRKKPSLNETETMRQGAGGWL